METWNDNGQKLAYTVFGNSDRVIVWGHGWGLGRQSLEPLARQLEDKFSHCLPDFPGFGDSPVPETAWTVQDYADLSARFIKTRFGGKKIIWAGHSFGARVGIKLAAHYPEIIDKMFLLSAAGLPVKKSFRQRTLTNLRIRLYKTLKYFVRNERDLEDLRKKFGSADYKSAGPLRKTFLNVINEDLSRDAQAVKCPVMLVYGENDIETPLEIGKKFSLLIEKSKLISLPYQDHYSVLQDGRHQVLKLLIELLEEKS